MKQDKPRKLALRTLNRLSRNPSAAAQALDGMFERESRLTARDRSFINHLIQGVQRWRLRLDFIIGQAADLPFKRIDPTVLNILRLALYQIFHLDRVPDSAAVNEAVKQAKAGRNPHAAPFVNGVLRNICRQKEKISFPDRHSDPARYLSIFHSFPEWLVQYWLEQWGEPFTEQLLTAENRLPVLTLRTNTLRTGREELMQALKDKGLSCRPTPYGPEGIYLSDFRGRVSDVFGFNEGRFQVQDQGAQIVSHLLSPRPGESILDLCAGLGGKTGHLAQISGDSGRLTALDAHYGRLSRLRENNQRLGIRRVHVVAADAAGDLSRLFRCRFEKILVDAPCSGLGVLSRHPDGKWNKEIGDFARLGRVQKKLLDRASNLLTPGGRMLYVTCTLSKEENEGVVQALLTSNQEIRLMDLRVHGPDWSRDLMDEQGFFRTYPHIHDMDGFFAALFEKRR